MKLHLKLALLVLSGSLVFTACEFQSDAGDKVTVAFNGIGLTMAYVPGGLTSPAGLDDTGSATVSDAYWIGETEVSYELWNAVYTWATDPARGANAYTFANVAWQGSEDIISIIEGGYTPLTTNQHPVTNVSWRDAMVFCNALSEWMADAIQIPAQCVYFTDADLTAPLRSVYAGSVDIIEGHEDNPYVDPDSPGFRLPTSAEWEVAARYIDGSAWLYGDHASGDTTGPCYLKTSASTGLGGEALSSIFGDYAVYVGNADWLSAAVKSKADNGLGLYDMSGNAAEWCFDWVTSGSTRAYRGGDWFNTADYLRTGSVKAKAPKFKNFNLGLRLVRKSLIQ